MSDSADPREATPASKLAVVLSGGGARGAYEAGVLSYILDELPQALGRPVRFSIVTGTSVGAIHACFLASTGGAPGTGARLIELWRSLSLSEVYHFAASDALRIPLWLLGGQGALALGSFGLPAPAVGARLPSVLDTGPLEELVARHIDWARIERQIAAGSFDALAVTATEIATGRSVCFVHNRAHRVDDWDKDPFVIARPARIAANHALASAAIPVLFPARRIDGAFYADGGLRLNTPLLPALRLGAERVLVIGLRHRPSREEEDRRAREREGAYLNPTYLAGKILNALLLDRVEFDVMQLRFMNDLLCAGREEFGGDFVERLNRRVPRPPAARLRVVENCLIQPSADVGELAGDCLARAAGGARLRDRVAHIAMRYAARGTGADKDLLSYLLFDRSYAEELLALGRKDAEAARDELLRILV